MDSNSIWFGLGKTLPPTNPEWSLMDALFGWILSEIEIED